LLAVGPNLVFEGLESLHPNSVIHSMRNNNDKTEQKTLRISDALSLGLCDQIPARRIHQGSSQ
jgi:hypothetical protein